MRAERMLERMEWDYIGCFKDFGGYYAFYQQEDSYGNITSLIINKRGFTFTTELTVEFNDEQSNFTLQLDIRFLKAVEQQIKELEEME